MSSSLSGAANLPFEVRKAIGIQVISGSEPISHLAIFQADKPVLVGVDAASTYCYLLESIEQWLLHNVLKILTHGYAITSFWSFWASSGSKERRDWREWRLARSARWIITDDGLLWAASVT